MNPVDQAIELRKEEVSKLKAENERLKQRIAILEENEGRIEDLTVAVEQKLKEPGSSKDIEGKNIKNSRKSIIIDYKVDICYVILELMS
jgi:hypothetical protein